MTTETKAESLTVTVPEAARMIGRIGRNKVYQLVREGRLPKVDLGDAPGTRVLIPRRAVLDFIEGSAGAGRDGES